MPDVFHGPDMEVAYETANHGWVKFNWHKDVMAVQPAYDDTKVTLRNGMVFYLRGRKYGV